eukprot:13569551-Alexandrium_andersonii.AAC.1
MSASLVGSEMCIRDSVFAFELWGITVADRLGVGEFCKGGVQQARLEETKQARTSTETNTSMNSLTLI